MKKALVPIADGTEEMEAVIIIDVLRRAGWQVVSAGIDCKHAITASRGVRIIPDADFNAIDPSGFDAVILPGGRKGADTFMECPALLEMIKSFDREKRIVAAVCAAPLVLQAAGIIDGRNATCHPAVRNELSRAVYVNERVVIDRNIITSQGPGTTFDFALAVLGSLGDVEAAARIAVDLVK